MGKKAAGLNPNKYISVGLGKGLTRDGKRKEKKKKGIKRNLVWHRGSVAINESYGSYGSYSEYTLKNEYKQEGQLYPLGRNEKDPLNINQTRKPRSIIGNDTTI